MQKRFRRSSKKAGLPPGTLVHIGERKVENARISLLHYQTDHYEEKTGQTIEECLAFLNKGPVLWINVDGIHDVQVVEQLGTRLGVHPLVQEDILHAGQRPKLEDYGSYIYFVLKILSYDKTIGEVQESQISLLLGPTFVVSFQEKECDLFDGIRERIKQGRGRIRNLGADYLLYAVIDTVVDHYFSIMETLGEQIEDMEDQLLSGPKYGTLSVIHRLRREMIFMRKAVWPLREVMASLERRSSPLIQDGTQAFLRDVYDHTLRVMDMVETFRDILSGMIDIYLSSVSNRMNSIMKVLTIIATIFIPLTFVASIYGMNFRFMPELEWHWSYPTVLVLMALVAGWMIVYFKKKDWM